MFVRFLRLLSHSQSLYRSRRSRTIFFIMCFFINDAKAELKNVDKIIIDGFLDGIIAPFKNGSKSINHATQSIDKKILGSDGSAEIEDGKVRIDTKNENSLKIAAEFRKNYKKPEQCKEPETEEIRTQCANLYIRARKAAMQ